MMNRYPFKTAYTQTQDLYGVELTDDEFENLGMIGWNRIGNKETRLYKFQVTPTQSDEGNYYVELPCNADILEAVVADYEDYQRTTPNTSENNLTNSANEEYIESRKFNTSYLYTSGQFVKHERVGNILYLSENFEKISVLYKGVVVDDEGLPSLNEKELDAIAVFCAFTKLRKQGIVSRDTNTMNLAASLQQEWKSLCTQARVAEYINQNEMDEVLNVASSWDRKRFGKSFKVIK